MFAKYTRPDSSAFTVNVDALQIREYLTEFASALFNLQRRCLIYLHAMTQKIIARYEGTMRMVTENLNSGSSLSAAVYPRRIAASLEVFKVTADHKATRIEHQSSRQYKDPCK